MARGRYRLCVGACKLYCRNCSTPASRKRAKLLLELLMVLPLTVLFLLSLRRNADVADLSIPIRSISSSSRAVSCTPGLAVTEGRTADKRNRKKFIFDAITRNIRSKKQNNVNRNNFYSNNNTYNNTTHYASVACERQRQRARVESRAHSSVG